MRARRFLESFAAFVGLVGIVVCQFAMLLYILFFEVGLYNPPLLVITLLPVVQKIGLEKVAGVHLCHEVVHFFGLGDCDPMVLAFNLLPVQLAGGGCDVGTRRVAQGLKGMRLDGELFLDRNNVPRLKLLNQQPNVLVFVTNVLFL